MSKAAKLSASFLAVLLVMSLSLLFADRLTNNDVARETVQSFGYVGVFVVSFIANLNVFVPVPPGTFTPIFISAGLSFWLIMIVMSVGTVLADLVGYFIGHLSKEYVVKKYPRTHKFFIHLSEEHEHWVLPAVFIYAAMAPFPNEAVVIPLGMIGYPLKPLILPITLGTLLYHIAFSYGITNIFSLLF